MWSQGLGECFEIQEVNKSNKMLMGRIMLPIFKSLEENFVFHQYCYYWMLTIMYLHYLTKHSVANKSIKAPKL